MTDPGPLVGVAEQHPKQEQLSEHECTWCRADEGEVVHLEPLDEVQRLRARLDLDVVRVNDRFARTRDANTQLRAEVERQRAQLEALRAAVNLVIDKHEACESFETFRYLAAAVSVGTPETEWRCSHIPRCADAACSDNPAMHQWINGPVGTPDEKASD